MTRNLYTPSTSPVPQAPDRLLVFIERAQLELVYSRRRDRRLGDALRPTVYDSGTGLKPAA